MEEILRSLLFQHLDGIVCLPTWSCLYKFDVLKYLIEKKEVKLYDISKKVQANSGYLHVALRTLASQGKLNYEAGDNENEIVFQINEQTILTYQIIEELIPIYQIFLKSNFFTSINWDSSMKDDLSSMLKLYHDFKHKVFPNELTEEKKYFLKMIEGFITGPIIVGLGMNGMFHKYFMETSFTADEFHKEPELFEIILDFLTEIGWFIKKNKTYQFTEIGLSFAKKATAYGVTVSYLPMLKNLEELIFGNASKIRETEMLQAEKHVNREMNVWGSGGAHSTYFKVIDSVIVSIFNQPLEMQPKGILDMGCGNGAFLIHLYDVIERFTLRGKHLQEYPLFLVGADYNQAALKVTRSNIIAADIWAKVIWGDISNPDLLAKDLKDNYLIELGELLNVRTFLDHNRIWENVELSENSKFVLSTGAYAFRGNYLSSSKVQENLKMYFSKWKPYIEKFGLLLIELHTVNPDIVSKNLGKTPATAYDATHGFSDQYILEIDNFINVLNQINLQSDSEYLKKFPNTEYATVSLHVIKSN